MQADNSEDQVKPSAQDQISHCRGGECQQLERMESRAVDTTVRGTVSALLDVGLLSRSIERRRGVERRGEGCRCV
jgi:hypothetical protein